MANIQGRVTCDSSGVIYLINDKICHRSSVGSCITDFKTRWGNHKSHIRHDPPTCQISIHFNGEFHDIVKNPLNEFDIALSNHLEVIIIEEVSFGDAKGYARVPILKSRESYWQNQFNTFESFGGLNKRDAKVEIRN